MNPTRLRQICRQLFPRYGTHIDPSIIYFRKTSQRIARQARHSSQQQTCAGANKRKRMRKYRISNGSKRRCLCSDTKAFSPFPRFESRRQALFSCRRRNKILRESNFAEKSKFSSSNSSCTVPTDSNGTPRGASTRGGGGRKGSERAHLMKAERLVLPEEISHFGLRRWWTEGWG